ncbi:MAG: hypothetical protein K9N35_02580 [Candidatus Marinimicrobia bacterium]|nr:hypothetical protein [Candidatus Neomarinimicrobiota bacterium]
MRSAPINPVISSIKSIFIVFIIAGQLTAQGYRPPNDPNIDIGDWRVSKEPIEFNLYASLSHAMGSAYIANVLEDHLVWWQADLTTLSLGLLWEIKDGYVPWEKAGFLGGEGFSSNDLKMDMLGIATNRVLPLLIQKVLQVKGKPDRSRHTLHFSAYSYPKLSLSLDL